MSTLTTKRPQFNREVLTFALVGVLNTALDFTILNVLVSIFHHHSGTSLALADVVAFLVATCNSYVLNARFTFRQKQGNVVQIARFGGVTIIGLGINSATVAVITPLFSHFVGAFFAINMSKLCATVFSLGWNYIAMRRWVFQAMARSQENSRTHTMPTSPFTRYRLRLVLLAATLAACASVIGGTIVQARLQSQISQLATPYHRPHITGADWPSVHMDAQHTDYNPREVTLSAAMMHQLALNGAYTAAQPAMMGASAGLSVAGALYFLGKDGSLYAVDAYTSTVLWRQALGTPATAAKDFCAVTSHAAGILWSNGSLYVGGADGTLYALIAQSGAILWKTALLNTTVEAFADAPWISDGHLYTSIIATGDCPHISGRVDVVDPATGALQAQLATTQASSGVTNTAGTSTTFAATLGGYIVAANEVASDTHLIAIGSNTSAKSSSLTKTPVNITASSSPLAQVAGGAPSALGVSCLILTTTTSGAACFDQNADLAMFNLTATEAQLRWQKHVNATKIVASVTDGHTLFIAMAGVVINGMTASGAIAAFDPLSGSLLWQAPIATNGIPLTLVGGNDFLVVGLATDVGAANFAVISMHDGATLYSHALSAPVVGTPVVADGEIVITTVDGHILDFGTAAPLSREDTFANALPDAQWIWVSQDAKHERQIQHSLQIDADGKYNVDDKNFLTEGLPQHDFSLTARMSFAPTLLNEQAVISAYAGPGNYIKVGLIHKAQATDQFELTAFVDGSAATTLQIDDTAPLGSPIYFQIVRLGPTYYGYVSSDGALWQSLGAYTPPYIATLAGLSAFTASNGDASTATFYSCTIADL